MLKMTCLYDSYITREELEVAIKEHGMGDEANIKEIISEVDKNNVKSRSINFPFPCFFLGSESCNEFCAGWKNRL